MLGLQGEFKGSLENSETQNKITESQEYSSAVEHCTHMHGLSQASLALQNK